MSAGSMSPAISLMLRIVCAPSCSACSRTRASVGRSVDAEAPHPAVVVGTDVAVLPRHVRERVREQALRAHEGRIHLRRRGRVEEALDEIPRHERMIRRSRAFGLPDAVAARPCRAGRRSYDRPETDLEERAMATIETDPSEHRPESGRADRRRREGARPLLVVGAERDQPDRGCRRRGSALLGLRRQALPRLRLAARQRQHRPPAPEDHPGDQGSGRQAVHDRPADGERVALGARPAARRGDARRSLRLVLHERRRRGQRERDQARPHGHRPPQGDRALPLLPRRHPRRRLADRRSAPLARRARDGGNRARVRPVHLPLPGRASRSVPGLHGRAAPRGDPPVRGCPHGRRDHPRDGHRHERDHRRRPTATSRACARSATATGSC